MRDKSYYSVRTGKNPAGASLDLATLLRVLRGLHEAWEDEGYFQEAFGYDCVDSGFTPGSLGKDIEAVLLLELRKTNLLPFEAELNHIQRMTSLMCWSSFTSMCQNPSIGHIMTGQSVAGTVVRLIERRGALNSETRSIVYYDVTMRATNFQQTGKF
jgi:hypothetical protein